MRKQPQRILAKEFLRAVLRTRARIGTEVKQEARKAGIKGRTLRRAVRDLGIEFKRVSDRTWGGTNRQRGRHGGWLYYGADYWWSLPTKEPERKTACCPTCGQTIKRKRYAPRTKPAIRAYTGPANPVVDTVRGTQTDVSHTCLNSPPPHFSHLGAWLCTPVACTPVGARPGSSRYVRPATPTGWACSYHPGLIE